MPRKNYSSTEAGKNNYSKRGFYLNPITHFWKKNEDGISYPQHVKDYYDDLVMNMYPKNTPMLELNEPKL